MLPHAGALVCPPPRHRLSGHSPHTLWLIFNTIPTILPAFPPRVAALPKPRSDPRCRPNPIAHRVRRKHQRLSPSLLIENASDRVPLRCDSSCPRRFRSSLATIRELLKSGNSFAYASSNHPSISQEIRFVVGLPWYREKVTISSGLSYRRLGRYPKTVFDARGFQHV